jgi:hypothetical protein
MVARQRHGGGAWLFAFALFVSVLLAVVPSGQAIKFELTASHDPVQKCIWDYSMVRRIKPWGVSFKVLTLVFFWQLDTLVIVTINVEPTTDQRIDLEIVDGSDHGNIYQSKRGVKGETRMAITTHTDADLGVCFTNYLDPGQFKISSGSGLLRLTFFWGAETEGVSESSKRPLKTAIDLDVDIGADAVDYNAIAKQGKFARASASTRKGFYYLCV